MSVETLKIEFLKLDTKKQADFIQFATEQFFNQYKKSVDNTVFIKKIFDEDEELLKKLAQ